MIDLLVAAQGLLTDFDYDAREQTLDGTRFVSFEDDSVIGVLSTFQSPESLLATWEPMESAMLRRHATSFRAAGDKAWNVYSVFLSSASADTEQSRQIRWIEENLERTRKIACCGIGTREDLTRALLPLMPLRFNPMLSPSDTTERFRRQVISIAPRAASALLNSELPVDEVLHLLEE